MRILEGEIIALRDGENGEATGRSREQGGGRKTRVEFRADGPSKELFGRSAGVTVWNWLEGQ